MRIERVWPADSPQIALCRTTVSVCGSRASCEPPAKLRIRTDDPAGIAEEREESGGGTREEPGTGARQEPEAGARDRPRSTGFPLSPPSFEQPWSVPGFLPSNRGLSLVSFRHPLKSLNHGSSVPVGRWACRVCHRGWWRPQPAARCQQTNCKDPGIFLGGTGQDLLLPSWARTVRLQRTFLRC